MNGYANTIVPLAHCRFEHVGTDGFPRVALLVSGERFTTWDEFVDDLGLKISSQRSYALSIGLMIDFMSARSAEFLGSPLAFRRFFRVFADDALLGTIHNGFCKYDLWWYGRTVKGTKRIVNRIFEFLDWIEKQSGIPSILPTIHSTVEARIKFWARWRIKKSNSLLGHLKSRGAERDRKDSQRRMKLPMNEVSVHDAPDRFPDRHFRMLLNGGFVRQRKDRWTTLRDMLILLLIHGGGLRISEALSLWIDDVYPDPDDSSNCIVRLYEPNEGLVRFSDASSGKIKYATRREYLKIFYNQLPRNMASGNLYLGNKQNLYLVKNEKYTLVFWRNASFGVAFKKLYSEYVMLRPRVVESPYMFISSNGTPSTIKGYQKVYAAACRRVGLVPRKELGTSPHGHRHSYVYYLKRAGLPEKIIQLLVHHRSAASQEVYDNASISDARAALNAITAPEETNLLN